MAVLTVQNIAVTGLNPVYVAATLAGDEFVFPAGLRCYVEAINGHSTPQEVKVEEQLSTTPLGTVEADRTVDVTNAQRRKIPVENSAAWVRASDGKVLLTYPDGVTALTVGVFSI